MAAEDFESGTRPRRAQCACGALSLAIAGEPVAHLVCHCNNCKRRTGSAFGISAYFQRSAVHGPQGKATVYALGHAASGATQERYFCSTCGSTLYWYVSTYPHLIGIAGGCFAEDPLDDPNRVSSAASQWQWVTLPSTWAVND